MKNEILTIQDKELDALFQKILPPHDYGEDSNVEELYNRIIDLEKKFEKQLSSLVDKIKIKKRAYLKCQKSFEKDSKNWNAWELVITELNELLTAIA